MIVGCLTRSCAKRTTMRAVRSGREPGVVGSASRGDASGTGPGIAAPPAGPSLDRVDGGRYVGRYQHPGRDRESSLLLVALVNDGESEPHWALTIVEGQGQVQKLIVVARDTFAFQLAPKQRVIFRRMGDSITAVSVRRGRDTTWAARLTLAHQPPDWR